MKKLLLLLALGFSSVAYAETPLITTPAGTALTSTANPPKYGTITIPAATVPCTITAKSLQYDNSGAFGCTTAKWDATNDWLGINITPEATLDVLNIQGTSSGANTAGRFQATGSAGLYALTLADAADGGGISVNTPDFTTTINDEINGVGLNMYSSAIASTVQLLSDGGDLFYGYDVTTGATIVIGNGQFFGANNGSYTVELGQSSAGYFSDSSGNSVTIADGTNAFNTFGPVNFYDFNTDALNFSVQTGGEVTTLYNILDDGIGNSSITGGLSIASSLEVNSGLLAGNPFLVLNNSGGVALIVAGTGELETGFNVLDDSTGNAQFFGNINIANVPYIWPTSNSAGVLSNDGSGNLSWASAGGGTPGGSQYDVQVNDGSGGFHGDSGLTYNYATGTVAAGSNVLTDGSNNVTIYGHAYLEDGVSVGGGDLTMVTGFGNNAIILTKGKAASGGAPLYFYSGGGINLTTPADGAMEYNGSHIYMTIGSTRYQLDQQVGSGVLQGSGGTPTCGSGCASITATSTDVRGSATSGTLATSVVVNFSTTLASVPFCSVSGSNASAALGYTATTSALTINLSTALTGDVITWHCPL